MRKLLAEGKIATYEKGEIVVRLIEQEEADEEEALIAASRCDDFDAAIELLAQECQLCMNVPKLTEVKKIVDFHFLLKKYHDGIESFLKLFCFKST